MFISSLGKTWHECHVLSSPQSFAAPPCLSSAEVCEDSPQNNYKSVRLPFLMRLWEKLVAGERFSPATERLQAVTWGCQKSSSVLNPFDGSPAERRDDISSLMELN